MPNHVLLNNIDHKDLRIVTDRSAALGDSVMFAVTFPFEFRAIQAHYPLFFQADANGTGYHAVAMFGFERGENLFLNDAGWDAAYVPLSVERQPFLIGFDGTPGSEGQRVIHLDMDSPRVSRTDGQPVFLEMGGNTPYLDRVAASLSALHDGSRQSADFVAALLAHDLLESFALDVELKDGSKNRLIGFHTINEDKLAGLGADALATLHTGGYLQAIYMAVASISHIRDLIDRKNAKLAAR